MKQTRITPDRQVRPMSEGHVKNNQEKPRPNIDKTFVLKPAPAKPKK